MEALLNNLDLLARRDMRRLIALCGVDAEDIADMVTEIRALIPSRRRFDASRRPRGARRADAGSARGSWLMELNPETLPRLLVNENFYARVAARAQGGTFISRRAGNANWLVNRCSSARRPS